jgi:hypothetical protein
MKCTAKSSSWSKFILLFICGVTAPLFCRSQNNLIKNPNLIEILACPDENNNVSDAVNWWKYDEYGSPEYADQCAPTFPLLELHTIPNKAGNQAVLSDNGYIHSGVLMVGKPKDFTLFDPPYDDLQFRESFGGSFKQPLENKIYRIEFYINFASYGKSGAFPDGRVATNAFDLLLLDDSIKVYSSVSPYINLNNVIKIHDSPQVINDTLNWVKLSTCFKANGGESFFAIGAFRDTSEIQLEFSGHSNYNMYISSYFFDDFKIYECPTCCPDLFPFIDSIIVSNNPTVQGEAITFEAILNQNVTAVLNIFDSASRLVVSENLSQLNNEYKLNYLASGMYHYSFKSSNGISEFGKVVFN